MNFAIVLSTCIATALAGASTSALPEATSVDVVSQFRNVHQLALSASVEVIVYDPSEVCDGVVPQTAIMGNHRYYTDGLS